MDDLPPAPPPPAHIEESHDPLPPPPPVPPVDRGPGRTSPPPPPIFITTTAEQIPDFETWDQMVSYYRRQSKRSCRLDPDDGINYNQSRRGSAIHPSLAIGSSQFLQRYPSMSTLATNRTDDFLSVRSSKLEISRNSPDSRGGSIMLDDSNASLPTMEDLDFQATEENLVEESLREEIPHTDVKRSASLEVKRGSNSRKIENTEIENVDNDTWGEFTNKQTGETLYYNKSRSQVASVEKPEASEAEPVLVDRALTKALRQVISQAADRETTLGLTAISNDVEDMPDFDDEPVNELKYFTHALMKMETMIKASKRCASLPGRLLSPLDQISDIVEEMQYEVEELSREVDESDIKALLGWNQIHWDFDNYHVDTYRSISVSKWRGILYDPWEHDDELDEDLKKEVIEKAYAKFKQDIAYDEWHMPRYRSNAPIPPQNGVSMINVVLPDGIFGKRKTRLVISPKETARSVVYKCFKKVSTGVDPEQYVLKAVGLNDYMYGSDLLFKMDYMISELRSGKTPTLELMKKPERFEEDEKEQAELKEFFCEYFQNGIAAAEALEKKPSNKEGDAWPHHSGRSIAAHELEIPFSIQIVGVDNCTRRSMPNLSGQNSSRLIVKCFMFYGENYRQRHSKNRFLFDQVTGEVPTGESVRWMTTLQEDSHRTCLYKDIPRLTRMAFMLFERSERNNTDTPIGYVVTQLMDETGNFLQGSQSFRLWPCIGKKKHAGIHWIFRATNRENLSNRNVCSLVVKFKSFLCPIVAPMNFPSKTSQRKAIEVSMDKNYHKKLNELLKLDALDPLKYEHFLFLWANRHRLVKYPELLPKFLLAVEWQRPEIAAEAHEYLYRWAPPYEPAQALIFLDVSYPDPHVRAYALSCLRRLDDNELRLYLLQLTQCLKYEAYHDSPLSRFMIERALKSPMIVGHNFFWHVKAEMAFAPEFCERYAVILEEYLSLCGHHLTELKKQNTAVQKLEAVSSRIVQLKREEKNSSIDCKEEMAAKLSEINKTFFSKGQMQVPLNPKIQVTTLIVEKCKYMSSKMVPLWLVFKNADPKGDNVYVIFKSGDDLRQDILTLQILQVMDRLWLSAGHDLRLNPYQVIATGVNARNEGVGMIQVVMNSETTSGIQLKHGGGAAGAFKTKVLLTYLGEHNDNKKNLARAVDNFTRSCAGYCVATFVMGIGDRHNDNIMCTRDGHLFHIDFGHFLGNFKKKFGFNRERTAFVFTPEMAYVMEHNGKRDFNKFLGLAKSAFNTCRQAATFIETLFLLMVPAGMPELMVGSDINYLKSKLYLSLDDNDAGKKLDEEIYNCRKNVYRQVDNFIHNLKHG